MTRPVLIPVITAFALPCLLSCPAAALPLDTPAASTAKAKAREDRPDLTGVVTTKEGKPIPGATVYVHTAAVRRGTSPFCPSCYPDCGKRARTDAQGRFVVRSVDAALTFNLLIVQEGYVPSFFPADPLKGAVHARLTPRTNAAGETDREYVTGVIRDPLGQPVAGATVEANGESQGNGGTYGTIQSADPLAVSDASGRFRLHVSHPDSRYSLLITARGLAPQIAPVAVPGELLHVSLQNGAALRGVVRSKDGKPLPGVIVHLNQKDRSVQTFVGPQQIGTNESGEFLFTNLLPDQEYVVCPAMTSLSLTGTAAPVATVRLPGDGKTLEGLCLQLAPARTLSGVLRLTDGKPVPAGTRVMLGREATWDVQFTEADAQGRFGFRGVPSDELDLSVSIRGYKLSHKTHGIENAGKWALSFPVAAGNTDVNGLELLFEPGQPSR